MHEFETERLKMRLLQKEDKDFFVSLYTDPKIMRHIAEPFTTEKTISLFNSAIKLNLKFPLRQLLWVIVEKKTGDICGIQNLSMHYEDNLEAEAGLILSRSAQGKFYPEEALVGMVDYAFNILKLKTTFAYSSIQNRASKRVVLKAGFKEIHVDGNKVSYKKVSPF
ncbi:GNAT family N-acetyltransferase [Shewanella sp. 10N.7]|uniref:GNAT family N-acetyltransferase n=1 Tax=Shewanella sp. 10N.7 TaxID=2885093 RepID=UPI001E623BBD|nr:GNAT family N-acetyltransferase [Shewanella sp. 10N.7]MCC4833676.1 GNAT family N-acetyltransferase [Shewanella sp. 10N.7]